MLISALCDYYDILSDSGKVLPEGYSGVKIHFLVGLSPEGQIAEIVDYCQQVPAPAPKGRAKTVSQPRLLLMPKRTEKSGIEANIVEHRPLYLFGLNTDKDALCPNDRTDKAKKSHEDFVKKQLAFLKGLDTPLINAYRHFVKSWTPETETENPHLLALGKAYSTSGFAFCLAGQPHILLQDEPDIKKAWEAFRGAEEKSDGVSSQCAITGEVSPIALIHDKIKGVPGGLATGNILVCFKGEAVESYGKAQSLNSNISETAMKKYTEALNYLLSDRRHRVMLDDVVLLHWAVSENELYGKIVNAGVFQDDDEKMDDAETDSLLEKIMESAREAVLSGQRLKVSEYIDDNVSFYMVGLKPNSARLAVEFIYRNRFGDMLRNIVRHQEDLRISENGKPIPLWRIKKELINPKSTRDTLDPALLSRLLEAIFNGYRYPEGLLATVIRRIKCDSNTENNSCMKLNPTRISIIKAYLNRRSRLSGQKEEITLALDKENKAPAYLCGRLFAVLERLQQDASGNTLNRTIKDVYFASACSTPAIRFPYLLKLAQHHIPKASSGGYWNYMTGEIMASLNGEFPRTLTLEEQGKFILGYYHQYFAKSEKKSNDTEAVTNNEED